MPADTSRKEIMIYTITGDNVFLKRQFLTERVTSFTLTYGDYALDRLSGDEVAVEQLFAAITSIPFLADKKLVVIRQASANKEFAEQLPGLVEQIPDTTDVILDEPKLDKRTAYYKWVKAHTQFQEFTQLDEQHLDTWMIDYVRKKGGELDRADAGYLLRRVGNGQQRLANELDKLTLLGGKITKHRINDLTEPSPQSKIFDLLDAAFSGDASRAMVLYDDQRAQKVEPQEILAMAGWQLRQIALAKTVGSHDLVREAKMSPYAASKAKRIADRMSLTELKRLVHDLTEMDARSKRSSLDLDQALRAYIVQITT